MNPPLPPSSPKVGLALSCGGARAFAQIGAIMRLQELAIPIDCIAGCSMGSLIAAAYAAGKFDYIRDFLTQADWKNIAQFFLELHMPIAGLLNGSRIMSFLEDEQFLEGITFDQLHIPCQLVATDLYEETQIILNEGKVAPAVRKSMALPGVLTPIYDNGRWHIDGGVVDPLPIDRCEAMGAEITIGIDVNLKKSLAKSEAPTSLPNVFEISTQAVRLFENQVTRQNLHVHKPTILIQPRVGHLLAIDFTELKASIQEGYDAVNRVLPQIKKVFPHVASL